MGERRVRNAELFLDFTDDHPFGMRRQQKPHDLESWLGAQCGKHIGVFRDLSFCWLAHISRIAEIWKRVNGLDDVFSAPGGSGGSAGRRRSGRRRLTRTPCAAL